MPPKLVTIILDQDSSTKASSLGLVAGRKTCHSSNDLSQEALHTQRSASEPTTRIWQGRQ